MTRAYYLARKCEILEAMLRVSERHLTIPSEWNDELDVVNKQLEGFEEAFS